MSKNFRVLLALLLLPTFALLVYVARNYYLDTRAQVGAEPASQSASPETSKEEAAPEPEPEPKPEPEPEKPLPATAMLDVPFTSQAPLGNWDPLHQEACEEASLLMVEYFLNNKTIASASAASTELEEIVGWEEARSYGVSITLAQLVEVAKGYYNRSGGRILENPNVADLQKEIAAGRPVIVPAAGRQLGNLNFTPPGPVYHMLVIVGYNETHFITNDPGTCKGENYTYTHTTLMNAIHDWNATNINAGAKKVLVFDA